jgi:hypothetical protein
MTAFLTCALLLGQTGVAIEKDLILRADGIERNQTILDVSDVKQDSQGDIYVLDSIRQKVAVFDSKGGFVRYIGSPKFNSTSQAEWKANLQKAIKEKNLKTKPYELINPKRMCVTSERLYILDLDKVAIYSKTGEYLEGFASGITLPGTIHIDAEDRIIIRGILGNSTKMYHVFKVNGELVASFGDFFPLPAKIAGSLPPEVDARSLGFAAADFYAKQEDELFCLNPYAPELRIYRGYELKNTLKNQSQTSLPVPPQGLGRSADGRAVYSIGLISPPTMMVSGGIAYVLFPRFSPGGKDRRIGDVELNLYQPADPGKSYNLSLTEAPILFCPDGNIYCVEYEENRFAVSRYHMKVGSIGNE